MITKKLKPQLKDKQLMWRNPDAEKYSVKQYQFQKYINCLISYNKYTTNILQNKKGNALKS